MDVGISGILRVLGAHPAVGQLEEVVVGLVARVGQTTRIAERAGTLRGLGRFLRPECLALPGIEAVYYDVTHKPPGTVEWE